MLGFEFHWSEIPMIIKLGLLLWLGAILCFVFMVACAIFPSIGIGSKTLLNVAYFGGTLFIVGILMVIIGLPKTNNRHPAVEKPQKKPKSKK